MEGCHARRIMGEIPDREQKARPLMLGIGAVLVVILLDLALEAYAAHRHAGAIETAKIFADCLNGQSMETEPGQYVTCQLHDIKLVKGIK